VTALLAMSIVIALFGIVNTLGLSIYERTRELGLLRAVGMDRRSVKRMIRWESVIIAILGGLLGIVAAGRTPFRLLATRRAPDGLYVGEVEWREPPARKPLPAAHEPLAALLKRVLEPLSLYRGVAYVFDDAAWVGGRLIELLPLGLAFKQSLLETADAVERRQPISATGQRLKFYYATQTGSRPPTIIFFVNHPKAVHFSYKRYLLNQFREQTGLDKTPVRLILRERQRRE